MNATYEWLYDNYALPQLEELRSTGNAQMELLVRAFPLSDWNRIEVLDQLARLRLQWGEEMFALGVQMGLGLAAPHAENL